MPSVSHKAVCKIIDEYTWNVDKQIVIQSLRPSIVLTSGKQCKTGSSKYGGAPDVADNVNLEIEKGFRFLFQINFAEIKRFDTQNLLPSEGTLYAFLKGLNSDHSYPESQQDFKLIYIPQSFTSDKRTYGRKMKFSKSYTLPNSDSPIYNNLNLSQDYETLYDVKMKLHLAEGCDFSYSNILGYPQQLQGYPWFSRIRDEIRSKLGPAPENPEERNIWLQQFNQAKEAWADAHVLLYQGATPFNDMSILYIGISREDLANRNFSAAFFDIQNT